jgi:uncharacterized membrane protein
MNDEIKQYLQPGKKNLIIIYVFYLCGSVAPLLPIIGAIVSYYNRNNTKDDIFISHYSFIIRTFAIWVVSTVISMTINATSFLQVVLSMCILIWLILRVTMGLRYLIEDVAHPNPVTYWIK